MERLNKFLAKSGVASRRKADELIAAGKVKVNNLVVTTLGSMVNNNDIVTINGQKITYEQKVYLLLNKPKGVVSTTSDDKGRMTVVKIVKKLGIEENVHPVGRLDFDTAGLLILTNDGTLTNLITHPSYEIEKEYVLRVMGLFPRNLVKSLNQKKYVMHENERLDFIKIDLNEYFTNPDSTQLQITLTAGKNHHVKKIFASLGYKVVSLTRIRIGQLTIDKLPRGQIRLLKPHEIRQFYGQTKNIMRKEHA